MYSSFTRLSLNSNYTEYQSYWAPFALNHWQVSSVGGPPQSATCVFAAPLATGDTRLRGSIHTLRGNIVSFRVPGPGSSARSPPSGYLVLLLLLSSLSTLSLSAGTGCHSFNHNSPPDLAHDAVRTLLSPDHRHHAHYLSPPNHRLLLFQFGLRFQRYHSHQSVLQWNYPLRYPLGRLCNRLLGISQLLHVPCVCRSPIRKFHHNFRIHYHSPIRVRGTIPRCLHRELLLVASTMARKTS